MNYPELCYLFWEKWWKSGIGIFVMNCLWSVADCCSSDPRHGLYMFVWPRIEGYIHVYSLYVIGANRRNHSNHCCPTSEECIFWVESRCPKAQKHFVFGYFTAPPGVLFEPLSLGTGCFMSRIFVQWESKVSVWFYPNGDHLARYLITFIRWTNHQLVDCHMQSFWVVHMRKMRSCRGLL